MAAFSQEAFLAWLKSKDADAEVGRAAIPCDCPLARALREINPNSYSSVHINQITCSSPYGVLMDRAPVRWELTFIRRIDNQFPRNFPVTAGDCLITMMASDLQDESPITRSAPTE